jgi:serine beta-lactamase-like protein LACTB, mitochondrial
MRAWMRLALAVALLLLGWPSESLIRSQDHQALSPDAVERIEKAITARMSAESIPGLSLAVVLDGKLVWSNGFGLSDLENFDPAQAATVYRLGSISKPLTATAVMELVEQGRLDLDTPIQKYCPSFPTKPWPITSRELLGHLGGVRHYADHFVENTRHYDSVTDGLESFKNDPLIAEPGTQFHYSSYGFNLLGCVVEGASGEPFAAFLTTRVFVPAGMSNTQVDDVFRIIPKRTRGYAKSSNGAVRNSDLMDSSYKIPSGGLSSTVIDLAKFAIALQSGNLLKPDTLDEMWTSQKTRDGKPTGYGMGWGVGEFHGVKMVAHSGGQSGTDTDLVLVPTKSFAVAAMCNQEDANMSKLARAIAEIVLEPATVDH